MDDKILDLLKVIQEDINVLKNGQARIEKKLDGVVDQTADLTEFRTDTKKDLDKIITDVTEIKDDLNNVEVITASNWKDIAKLKAVR